MILNSKESSIKKLPLLLSSSSYNNLLDPKGDIKDTFNPILRLIWLLENAKGTFRET